VPFGLSNNSISSLLAPASKGLHLITVHAGGNQGFIPEEYICSKSHKTTGIHHSDMNYKDFYN
jgi:hypothetical protein